MRHAEIKPAAEPLEHGGDLSAARRLFLDAPEPFIDLSTGINPYPYTTEAVSPLLFERLPQPDALGRLLAAATEAYGAPSPACVVAAPGTQILLPLVAALKPAGRAAVLGPTYPEHARAAALGGHRVTEAQSLRELADADLAILVNPNNPDGRIIAAADLLALADEVGRFARTPSGTPPSPWKGEGRGGGRDRKDSPADPLLGPPPFSGRKEKHNAGLLVVDEAFMDVGPPAASLAREVERGGIVVLRSFGKFFGLAGLRLGFAIAAPDVAVRLRDSLGPWAVSGPALAIGGSALADHSWIDATRRKLAQAAQRLDKLLADAGLEVVGGTSLFRLAQTSAASQFFDQLGHAGILVRRFADRPTWLRFGLPADEQSWRRLANALARSRQR